MDEECINCRFCFKLFELFEDVYIITDEIKQIYEDLTCTELVPFIIQKSYSCQKCLTSLLSANVTKYQFIVNQKQYKGIREIKPVEIKSGEVIEDPPKKVKRRDRSGPKDKKTRKVKVEQQPVDTPTNLTQCHLCFRIMKDIKSHFFRCHKKELPTCDRCGKSFFKKEFLEQHMYYQYLCQRIPCQYCPENNQKTFLAKKYLDRHIKIKHNEALNQQ